MPSTDCGEIRRHRVALALALPPQVSLVIGRAVGQSTVRKTQYFSKQTPYAGYSPTGTLRHHTRRRGHASCGSALQPTIATALSVPRLSAARTRGPTSDLHFSNLNEKLILLKDASAENLAGTWRRQARARVCH